MKILIDIPEEFETDYTVDKFKEFLGRVIADMFIKAFEDSRPYDPDKVVEQLGDYGNEEIHYYKNTPYEKCIEECINKAIQIVKGGGVDAETDS